MPDRAEVAVSVEGDGGSRDAAYSAAAQLSGRVDAVFSDMAEAIERVVTAVLTVQPRTRWKKGEATRAGWRAARSSRELAASAFCREKACARRQLPPTVVVG